MNMDLSPVSSDALRPPPPRKLVYGSLLIALILNLLPWSGVALLLRPDFLLLVTLYWAIHESRSVGHVWGFALGLVMDVADSALLGQHAMMYAIAIYLAQSLRIRILHLTLIEQAVHVLGILFVAHALYLLLNLSLGREFVGWAFFVAPILGALLWAPVHYLATLPRFRRRSGNIMI